MAPLKDCEGQGCHAQLCRFCPALGHWVKEQGQELPWGMGPPSQSESPVFGLCIDKNVMSVSSNLTLLHGTLVKDLARTVKPELQ